MTRVRRTLLVCVLRFFGVSALFALPAVFMPTAWMAATHRWLGMGEFPNASIVEYLARSLSGFYFFFGTVCLLAASDLDRYRPVVRLLAVAFMLLGLAFLGIDISSGMPWWWSAFEGPPQVAIGVLILWLAR